MEPVAVAPGPRPMMGPRHGGDGPGTQPGYRSATQKGEYRRYWFGTMHGAGTWCDSYMQTTPAQAGDIATSASADGTTRSKRSRSGSQSLVQPESNGHDSGIRCLDTTESKPLTSEFAGSTANRHVRGKRTNASKLTPTAEALVEALAASVATGPLAHALRLFCIRAFRPSCCAGLACRPSTGSQGALVDRLRALPSQARAWLLTIWP